MSTQIAVKEFDVSLGLNPAQVLGQNSNRKYLQIQCLGPGSLKVKFDNDFIPPYNSIQTITFPRIPTTGSAQLMQGAVLLATITPATTAAALSTAINTILGAGSVTVTGTIAAGFNIEFTGNALNGIPQVAFTIGTNTLADETTEASAVQNIVWIAKPTSGTYTVSNGTDTTAALPWDTDQDELKAALNALPSINGGISAVTYDVVTGNFSISYGAPLANQPVPLLTVVSSATNTQSLASEVDGLFASPEAFQGTYQLFSNTDVSVELAYNSHAATIQAALSALPSIGAGNVTVTANGVDGHLVDGYTITFGGVLANTVAPTLQVYYWTATPLHPDIYQEPQKRVMPDISMLIKREVLGAGPVNVTASCVVLRAGATPAAVVPVIIQTQLGAIAPNEGIKIASGAMLTMDTAAPIGSVWAAANQANTLATIWVG